MKSINDSSETIDIEKIIIDGRFWGFDEGQYHNFVRTFYQGIGEMAADSCVLIWKHGNRSFKNLEKVLQSDTEQRKELDMEGCVKTQSVTNAKEMRQKCRDFPFFFPSSCEGEKVFDDGYSIINRELVLKQRFDPVQLKKGIVDMFDMEGKKWMLQWKNRPVMPDFAAGISPLHLDFAKDRIMGQFYFTVWCYTIEESSEWADRIIRFAMSLTTGNQNVNIIICKGGISGEYSLAYGKEPCIPSMYGRDSLQYRNMLKSFYFTDVGWGHIICGQTQNLGFSALEETEDILETEEMPGGYVFVHPRKSIFDADITELKAVKKYLYKMVMPREFVHRGEKRLVLSQICWHWLKAPVFQEEVSIREEGVCFQHYGEIKDYEELKKYFV